MTEIETDQSQDRASRSGRFQWDSRKWLGRYALVLTWLLLIAIFSTLRPNTFGTTANFKAILGTQSVLVVLALAVLWPLIVGEFDLSIGANLIFASVIVAILNVNHHWPIGAAILIGLAVATAVGVINGLLVVKVGVDGVIATVAMLTFLTGISLGVTNYVAVGGVSRALIDPVTDRRLGLPASFFYALLLAAFSWYILRLTPLGRHLRFVGKHPRAAHLSGLPVDRLRLSAFASCGFLAGVAGTMLTGTLGAADPNSGGSYLLPAYSAAFLGTAAIEPGAFNVVGTVIAVYFLITGVTGLQLLGLENWIEQVFYGIVLAAAVTISRVAARRRAQAEGIE